MFCIDLPGLEASMELLDGETADSYITTVCVDDGKGYLKATLNRVRRGEVAMKEKRGKEVPINDDRGVKHSQVINSVSCYAAPSFPVFWCHVYFQEYLMCGKTDHSLNAVSLNFGI